MIDKQENKLQEQTQHEVEENNTPIEQENTTEDTSEEIEDSTDDDENQNAGVNSDDHIDAENQENKDDEKLEEADDFVLPQHQQEDFNWEEYEKSQKLEENPEFTEFNQMYNETLSTINEKEIVEGTVVSIGKREVVINIGYKSEGVVSLNEFRYNPDLKVGDKVNVYIENKEDKEGQLILAHKKARTLKAWEQINRLHETGEIVKGYIKSRTKGGMIVDLFGIETFLPGSQIDVKPIRDYDAYVDKTMDFKVVKINHEFKNVVVSHKILIEAELEQQKKEIISKLEKGQVLEGTVKNITSYGVFIDLGGVDGLIHITDLSWGRINHPEEIVQLDQKLNVVVLDFDEDKTRIALGLKQLTPHPWESLDENLKVGDIVNAKVVVLADYGAFVEIKPGVEGLIHVSEMSWSQQLRSAQDFLQIGDEVEAKILTLDREERKMALSLKQLKPDPWESIEEKYPVDSKTTAKVKNFTKFGIFVEIEEGIDGLIHISDLSWTKKINHPAEFTSVNDEIEVVVLEINKENRRLRLGHKQLEENPWDVFENIFNVNSIHEGTIIELLDKGAKVSLPYGVEGFASKKHLEKQNGKMPELEEKLPFKVIDFSKDDKKIILSHVKAYKDQENEQQEEARKNEDENVKKTTKKIKQKLEKTTLGDLSTDLENLKSSMTEEAAKKSKTAPKSEPKQKKEEAADKKEPPKSETKASEAKEEKNVKEAKETKETKEAKATEETKEAKAT
ncbi:MAG: 30S ribosomal protein S1, partial [Bacteroidota bacterium]